MQRTSTVIRKNAILLHKSGIQGERKGNMQRNQKRGLYFALPVIVVPAIAIFVGITFWQVYSKRQKEEELVKRRGTTPSEEAVIVNRSAKPLHKDPRLR
jgi:hypothetical protein